MTTARLHWGNVDQRRTCSFLVVRFSVGQISVGIVFYFRTKFLGRVGDHRREYYFYGDFGSFSRLSLVERVNAILYTATHRTKCAHFENGFEMLCETKVSSNAAEGLLAKD